MLSIIIPIYNVESYLRKCIDSVLSQTYQDWELILVDDGSSDNCPEICDEYAQKDERILVIHKENGGQGSARNQGLNVAKGDYISFIDSDDYIEPEMYAVMIEALERTGSDISICGLKTHSGIRVKETVLYGTQEVEIIGAEEILRHYFKTPYVTGSPVDKIYRKELFQKIRFPEGVAREDVYIMHYIYGACNKVVHTGKCFYNYIVREGSSENQEFSPKFLISMQIADERHKYIRENFPALLSLSQISVYGSRLSAIKKITRSNAIKKYKTIYDELRTYIRENPAPTKGYKKLRKEILYFPWLYKLKMDISHKWRKKIKHIVQRSFFRGRG